MEKSLVVPIVTAIVLGLLVGLQRSITNQLKNEPVILGSRTFSLISLIGFLSYKIDPNLILPFGFITASYLLATYIAKVLKTSRLGITTQFSALITYLAGILCAMDEIHLATFVVVIMILLLEIKPKLQKVEQRISSTDINAVILLLVMSFVILPLLPNRFIGPYQIFNPYQTWLMAILIASISFIGYVAIKIFGHRYGLFLTGAAGGLISSTAVTFSLASMYKEQKSILYSAISGIAIAWTFMFIRVLVESAAISIELAKTILIPYLLTALMGLIYTKFFFSKSDRSIYFKNETLYKNPLQLSEAIKFALLFGLIYGAIKIAQEQFGSSGVYIVSFISGISDVDAITLSLSQMSKEQRISLDTAIYGIIIASLTNTFVKLLIASIFGGKELAKELLKLFLLLLISMVIGLYLAKSFSITFG